MATRNEIGLSAQHLLPWNNWYYTGLADFLQSSVQGIQLKSTFGGGIGRIIKNTGRGSFNVYGGFAWQKINYQEALSHLQANKSLRMRAALPAERWLTSQGHDV
jgi:Protein of unknown function, DUF481